MGQEFKKLTWNEADEMSNWEILQRYFTRFTLTDTFVESTRPEETAHTSTAPRVMTRPSRRGLDNCRLSTRRRPAAVVIVVPDTGVEPPEGARSSHNRGSGLAVIGARAVGEGHV